MDNTNGIVVDHHRRRHDTNYAENDNEIHENDITYLSPTGSPSLSRKLHSSLCNMSCCFRKKHRNHHHHTGDDDGAAVNPGHVSKMRLLRSSSVWMKSRAHNHLPEIKNKCRNLISRIGRHRRRHSAEFRYDVVSYSRNFDQGSDEDSTDDVHFPFKSFSSRLPQSPPPLSEEEDEEESQPRSAPASASPATEIVSAL